MSTVQRREKKLARIKHKRRKNIRGNGRKQRERRALDQRRDEETLIKNVGGQKLEFSSRNSCLVALFDNLAQSSLFGDWQRLQREAGSADFEEFHIFLLLQSLTHLMGHDDKFLKNPLNCKGYLQNIEFDNLDCTFTQVSSVDKNVLCKGNTKKKRKICLFFF